MDRGILETTRLRLRTLSVDDAEFIRELLNDPGFLRHIGDRKVRTAADARDYILRGPIDSYARHGFGLYLVELKDSRKPIGICGLLKRDWLEDPDIGFAFLARFTSMGFGYESAAAVLAFGRQTCGLSRVAAITSPDNVASIGLLTRLGFHLERDATSSEGDQVKIFVSV
jgi:RimJ/RimL family protein N-acetyltransferase